ncbi:uncharacterized protein [Rutidosis leptorrhynchoides]|uniref:uncharacterized protein n=1 Tax=Rutidosis leptorrhynchoides TaxID=125765 RepID=UPI003A99A74F
MASTSNGNHINEIEECVNSKTTTQSPLEISVSRKTLLSDGTLDPGKSPNRFVPIQNRISFLKLGSASAKFMQIANDRDEISRSVTSSNGHRFRERLNGVFSRKIDWGSLRSMCKEWIRNPMNMALFVWIFCVAISGAILFMVMTGMLNGVLPKKSVRNTWFEVNNQILNALFTLMCLYQHPQRFHHLVLLIRWRPEDISRLRKIYCKNGTYKPHEWTHIMVVVLLLHLNCFAQYALCGLNLGYKRSERPAIGVAICISVAIGAPAIAGVYMIVSPLGKDYTSEGDVEAQVQITDGEQLRVKSLEKKYSFAITGDEQRVVESQPKWSGGILDIWDDISIAYLSLFCTFCVFGWNMERLGFGNMYVHIATFILFCAAPFWIFNFAAVNIGNDIVQGAMSVSGIILCAFGLLYGGYWRIQMRKRFNLPAYTFCCGKPEISDCTLWLCCCWCTLAQEVRTGNFYEVMEDELCTRQGLDDGNNDELMTLPSPVEGGLIDFTSGSASPTLSSSSPTKNAMIGKSQSPSRFSKEFHNTDWQRSTVKEDSCTTKVDDQIMIPPVQLEMAEREYLLTCSIVSLMSGKRRDWTPSHAGRDVISSKKAQRRPVNFLERVSIFEP